MILDLNIQFDRQKFRSYCEHLLKRQVLVEIKEKKLQRTLSQNSYLHLLLSYFGSEVGMTLEQVKHDVFKEIVNKDIFEVKKAVNGKEFTLLRSTASLDKEEMARCIDRFMRWSEDEVGVPLPEASNEAALKEALKQIEMCQRYI